MNERCLRPLLCTVKAELGQGQPGLIKEGRMVKLCQFNPSFMPV